VHTSRVVSRHLDGRVYFGLFLWGDQPRLVNKMGTTADRFLSRTINVDSPRSTIVLVCLVAGLSYLAPRLEGALMLNPQTTWPLWPGCAILVSVLMLVPTRMWAALMLAAFAGFVLYDLQVGVPVASIAWFLPADTIQVVIAGVGLRYCFDRVPRLNNISSLAKYSFFAVFLAPFAAAFASARGIPGNYWTSWRITFLSEVLAFITLTPAILSWFSEGPGWVRRPRAYYLEFAAMIAATVLLGYFTFGVPETGDSPALLYALVPFLLWSALRFGSIGITSSMIVISFLSVWGVVHGRGPFNGEGPLGGMLPLQLFLIFAAIPFMILTALVEDRKRAGEKLASLSRGLLEAQEKERTRIARELHDDIGQRFALVAVELQRLQEKFPDATGEVHMRINELRKEISGIATDIQSLSHELHSSKLEYLGLVAAMKIFCKEFAEHQNMQIDFQSHDLPTKVPHAVSLCLFRVLQESLHNSAKHSGVRHFEARLWGASGEIHLTVRDSGVGFDQKAARGGPGLGLISMRERLKLVNGTFSIKSQLASGTTIHARIPLDPGAITSK
jgi:signal transduction histidine kinase